MSGKTLLAALAGAILMYIFASAWHLSPAGQVGVSQAQNDSAMVAAIQSATGDKPGLYHYPYVDMSSKDAMKAMTDKLKTSPSGILIYNRAGLDEMGVKQLGGEFVVEFIETLLALWLLSLTSIVSFGGRVGFMAGAGLIAGMATNVSYMIWYNFPLDYTATAVVYEVLKFVFAGVAAAFVLGMKPKSAPATA